MLIFPDFYPRPPRGGRHWIVQIVFNFTKFLSTPSARRATSERDHNLLPGQISIHALREEGDSFAAGTPGGWTNFYPRPPRGGRLQLVSLM